jgi:hypothetical protein
MSPAAPPWSLPTRVAFRFLFCWLLLLIGSQLCSQFLGLHWAAWLLDAVLAKPTEWFTHLAAWLVHAGPFDAEENGSGDRLVDWLGLLGKVIFAAVLAGGWSAADRRSERHDRLYGFLRVYVRLWLASHLISYGLIKVVLEQMLVPSVGRLEERIGDASPMGLLWTTIGASATYERFAGLSECVAGVLLLWSRTALAGALLAAAIMTNVVMFNLCYDVPVKIFSSTLLLTAVFLCAKDAPRILGLLRGSAVEAAPRWTAPSPRWARAAGAFEVVAAVAVLVSQGWALHVDMASRPPKPAGVLPFEGNWRVEKQVADGREVPGLLSEDARWQTVRCTTSITFAG